MTRTPTRRQISGLDKGRAQLSLVEHALCPLDPAKSLTPGRIHLVRYDFSDKHRNRKQAVASIASPFGLSANDELYLYGLLAIHLAQPDPSLDFYATPHFCLRQLGIVHRGSEQGKRYATFREAIRRLSGIVYQNNNFYDPIRGEHRDVTFGLLKYSLPLDPGSSRAWQFVWDPQFFRFCKTIRGSFQFDFHVYRQLDYASRRLFLLLQKVFWRNDYSPAFELRHLGINVLGFAETLPTKVLKAKVARCAARLLSLDVITLPLGSNTTADLFAKRGKGVHEVRFFRGPYFDRQPGSPQPSTLEDSPLYDPLCQIGFDAASIGRIIREFKPNLAQEWADITIAAVERGIVRQSPQAYFMHYIQEARARRTTPPDWWRELRRQEYEQRRGEHADGPVSSDDEDFDRYLQTEARGAFERIMDRLFRSLRDAGQTEAQASKNAEYSARMHLRRRFQDRYPNTDPTRMSRLGDLL